MRDGKGERESGGGSERRTGDRERERERAVATSTREADDRNIGDVEAGSRDRVFRLADGRVSPREGGDRGGLGPVWGSAVSSLLRVCDFGPLVSLHYPTAGCL